jgi:catechol 2,3-dioxygenase-like lactoylglutathione lyase family enzyme
MNISHFDHLVLTVADIETTVDFYTRVLSMHVVGFADGRKALRFGHQKINLHHAGNEFEPKADRQTPGSADLCLIVTTPMDAILGHLKAHGVDVLEGPVRRTGATGPILSVYLRDPDLNLIELSNLIAE